MHSVDSLYNDFNDYIMLTTKKVCKYIHKQFNISHYNSISYNIAPREFFNDHTSNICFRNMLEDCFDIITEICMKKKPKNDVFSRNSIFGRRVQLTMKSLNSNS